MDKMNHMKVDIDNKDIRDVIRLRHGHSQNDRSTPVSESTPVGNSISAADEIHVTDKPRMIKVLFNSEECVRKFFLHINRLNSSMNAEIRNVRVFRDLNKEDRQARDVLLTEMKQKNEELKREGESNFKWVIRAGKVVKVGASSLPGTVSQR